MRKTIAKLSAIAVLLLCLIQTSFAQGRTVTGTITDFNGIGIPGVTVAIKGTKTATQTNASGEFSINASENATLVISAVGYASQEVQASTTALSVTMQVAASDLNEVVVI